MPHVADPSGFPGVRFLSACLIAGVTMLCVSTARAAPDRTVLYSEDDWYVVELETATRHQCQIIATNHTGTSFSMSSLSSTDTGVSVSLQDKNFTLSSDSVYNLRFRIDGRSFGPYRFTAQPRKNAIFAHVRYGGNLAEFMAAVARGNNLTVIRRNGYEVSNWSLASSYRPFQVWRRCSERLVGVR